MTEETEVSIARTKTETAPPTGVTLTITTKEMHEFSHIIEIGRMINKRKDRLMRQGIIIGGLLAVAALELSYISIPPEENPFLHARPYIENPVTIGTAALTGAFFIFRNALRSSARLKLIDDKAHQIQVGPLPPAQTESPPPTDDQMPN